VAGDLPHRPGVVRLTTIPPEALFVVSAIAQYVGAVIAVNLFDEVAPVTVAWFRVLGASLALLAVSAPRLARGGRWTRAELAAAAVFGVATALMNTFFYLAIERLPLGKGVTIEFIGPIAVAAARTRTGRNAVALGLAALGVAVLSGLELNGDPVGLVFILAASAMWAAYIVVGAKVARLDRGVAGLGMGLGCAAVVLVPVGVPGSGQVWVTPSLLFACAAVGVFSSAIGYGIDQHVLRRIPVRRFSVLLALLPVTATVVGFVGLDQTPSVGDLAGMTLVIAGVVVQSRDTLT
jgi:inner membrane transporter RhtA